MSFTLPPRGRLPDCEHGALGRLTTDAEPLEGSTGAVLIRSPRRECTIRSRRNPVSTAPDRAPRDREGSRATSTEPQATGAIGADDAIASATVSSSPRRRSRSGYRVFSDPAGARKESPLSPCRRRGTARALPPTPRGGAPRSRTQPPALRSPTTEGRSPARTARGRPRAPIPGCGPTPRCSFCRHRRQVGARSAPDRRRIGARSGSSGGRRSGAAAPRPGDRAAAGRPRPASRWRTRDRPGRSARRASAA